MVAGRYGQRTQQIIGPSGLYILAVDAHIPSPGEVYLREYRYAAGSAVGLVGEAVRGI